MQLLHGDAFPVKMARGLNGHHSRQGSWFFSKGCRKGLKRKAPGTVGSPRRMHTLIIGPRGMRPLSEHTYMETAEKLLKTPSRGHGGHTHTQRTRKNKVAPAASTQQQEREAGRPRRYCAMPAQRIHTAARPAVPANHHHVGAPSLRWRCTAPSCRWLAGGSTAAAVAPAPAAAAAGAVQRSRASRYGSGAAPQVLGCQSSGNAPPVPGPGPGRPRPDGGGGAAAAGRLRLLPQRRFRC